MSQVTHADIPPAAWKRLYRVGGLAALMAGVFFRRNIAAEIGPFTQREPPGGVAEWFALLQSNRLLALAYLNVFDLVNYVLLGLMFLALYAALVRVARSAVLIATALGLTGIAVALASNTAFSMLSLSDQVATATTEAQTTTLLAAGQAMLALNRFSTPGAHPGAAGTISLLLVAVASIVISVVMLRSAAFNRVAAYVGILAGALDVAYCIAYTFAPGLDSELLAVLFIPAAGLFLMIWHMMVGWRLYRLGGSDVETLTQRV